ncbi:hypothetical protein LG634_14575 [Streptomyces bambusae]|uniref:hypothetical protein n=1 Tax=Streptomyces bambusae TaxID=1550616 RepID=UPI001CFCF659|nr:hypothetical protein [Streptomyces bambusae]MCB5166056.1 hypothetical protein [Streptomyces bambusae]
MESGPAWFAGLTFVLFGVALLAWTAARAVRRAPVADGVGQAVAVPLSLLAGAVSLALGVWCFTRL